MGFTSGIAVLIFSTQIKDFLGSERGQRPLGVHRENESVRREHRHDPVAHVGPRGGILRDHFGMAQEMAAARARIDCGARARHLAVALFRLPVETIGSKFGGIPQGLPRPQIPALSWENIQHLFQPALTIALLAAIESLLCAVVADGMVDDRHDANQELMAQGLANISARCSAASRPPAQSPAPPPTSRAARAHLSPA